MNTTSQIGQVTVKTTIIILIIAVALGVAFYLAQGRNPQESNTEFSDEKLLAEENTSVPSDWKTYRNGELGIEFHYPSEWEEQAGHDSTVVWFKEGDYDLSEKLQVGFIATDETPLTFAQRKIQIGGLPDVNAIIKEDENSALYVQYGSISSESYVYVVKIQTGLLTFDYHDDFEDSDSQEEKIKTLEQIVGSIRENS